LTKPSTELSGKNNAALGKLYSRSGRGNLIIGNDEVPTNNPNPNRSGSHNLVIGMANQFTNPRLAASSQAS
jgi:hypothetical protein